MKEYRERNYGVSKREEFEKEESERRTNLLTNIA